jgi:hypothetical protein
MAGNATSFPIATFKIVIRHIHLIHEEVIYGILIAWQSDKHSLVSIKEKVDHPGEGECNIHRLLHFISEFQCMQIKSTMIRSSR